MNMLLTFHLDFNISASADVLEDDLFLTENDQYSPLKFTEETILQPRRLRVIRGSSVTIKCSVSGHPYPELMWLKV